MTILDDVAPPALLDGLGPDEEHGVPDDEEDEAEPREDSHDAEAGCGQVEHESRQEDEDRPEHYPAGGDGEGAAGDGLLEVLPSESSESLLAVDAWEGSLRPRSSVCWRILFDLSLVLLRHVTTLWIERAGPGGVPVRIFGCRVQRCLVSCL